MTYRRPRRRPGEERFVRRAPAPVYTRSDVEFVEYLLPVNPDKQKLEVDEEMTALMSGNRPSWRTPLSPWGVAAGGLVSVVIDKDHMRFPAGLRSWVLSATCIDELKAAMARSDRSRASYLVRLGRKYAVQATPDAGGLFGTPFAADVSEIVRRLRADLAQHGAAPL